MIKTVGSVCSGIEAASVAWMPLGFSFEWFSETAAFPSKVLRERYPSVINLGDMNGIVSALHSGSICAPDLICGGTPCQAFSLAGWKNGLNDERGNLTLTFVNIVEANDTIRQSQGLEPSIVFWENVEGVLTDKTNAFGCLVTSLAGFNSMLKPRRWPNAGVLKGPKRNVAWRVLDAKYFGLPHQRRRLYVVAGGRDFLPEDVLFEKHEKDLCEYPPAPLRFTKNRCSFEVFREYTDCLYSAYGTKWNGNAAAFNGSLYIVQNDRIRRLSPLECERLMGLPDNHTGISGARRTNRYQAIGNSWAVPVVRWIGSRMIGGNDARINLSVYFNQSDGRFVKFTNDECYYNLGNEIEPTEGGGMLNCSAQSEDPCFGTMKDIVSEDAPEDIYISPVGSYGIIRRAMERNITLPQRLKRFLLETSSQMSPDDIEKKSRVQSRGKYDTLKMPIAAEFGTG
jgi:DNA (cytosine-5)-methyltransferase 1